MVAMARRLTVPRFRDRYRAARAIGAERKSVFFESREHRSRQYDCAMTSAAHRTSIRASSRHGSGEGT